MLLVRIVRSRRRCSERHPSEGSQILARADRQQPAVNGPQSPRKSPPSRAKPTQPLGQAYSATASRKEPRSRSQRPPPNRGKPVDSRFSQPFAARPCYSVGARSSDSNPHDLWAPSQKGWLAEFPQRQSAIAGFSGRAKAFPSESVNVKGPSTRKGPLGRIVILVFSDMMVCGEL